MTLAEIEGRLYDRLGYSSTPPTDVVTRLRRHVNGAYVRVMGKKGYDKLRQGLVTFASVANIPYAVLPQAVTAVYSVADRSQSWLLHDVTVADIRLEDPGAIVTGRPYAFARYNLASAVARQPSDSSELLIASTSASDGATKTCHIQGITSTGALLTTSAAMNGTTAVSLGTGWVRVDKLWIALTSGGGATTAVGTISLYEDAAPGTVLSQIDVGRASARYSMLHLYPTPTSAITYTADAMVRLVDLANGGDEPLLPEDYHQLLVAEAEATEWRRRENPTLMAAARAEATEIGRELSLYVNRYAPPSHVGIPRYSQLGNYFPAGT